MPPPPPPTDLETCLAWSWHRSFHDCCRFRRPPHLRQQPVNWQGFVGVFLIKFLLEVCGAGGAVWGFSEIMTWRYDEASNDVFRTLALATFAVFVVRFYWHAKHWLEHEHDFPYVKIHHRRQHWIFFVQVFSAKLLLQVCGAAGAIWGASDAVGWRVADNQEKWRTASKVTAVLFAVRFVVEILSYCLLCQRCTETNSNNQTMSIRLVMILLEWNQVIAVKFILEVCGAVGAVWGFAEAVQLRTPDNSTTIFRPIALVVGAIFGARWLWQAACYVAHESHVPAPLVTEPMTLQKESSRSMPSSARLSLRAMMLYGDNENAADTKKDSDHSDEEEVPSNTAADDELATAPFDLCLVETGDTKESHISSSPEK